MRYTPSVCDPACGEACIDGDCVAQPLPSSAGTLTLTGIAPSPVTVEPSDGGYWWQAENAYATSEVGLAADGDDVPAFALEACVPPRSRPTATGARCSRRARTTRT